MEHTTISRKSLLLTAARHVAWITDDLLRPPHLERLFDLHTASSDLLATFEQLATGAMHPVKVLVHYDPS